MKIELPTTLKPFSVDRFEFVANDDFCESPEKEAAFFRERDLSPQDGFLSLRIFTLATNRKIVEEVLSEYLGNVERCVEFGSGAYGTFYTLLLPEQLKQYWTQYEVNPIFNRHNKLLSEFLFSSPSSIEEGSAYEMPLEDNSIDLVAGLSSWDSMYFQEKAMSEVRRVLKPGGMFVHFQDILPSDGLIVCLEDAKRKKLGLPKEFDCGFYSQKIEPFSGSTQVVEQLISVTSIDDDNEEVRLGKYLHHNLARISQSLGMEVLFNDTVEHQACVDRTAYQSVYEYLDMLNQCPSDGNSFYYAFGKKGVSQDESLPNDKIKQWSMMDVLVVRKD
jgi:SAM-dependent methyltransferase